MSDKRKHEVVTFKVDQALWEQLQSVPNRSEFIRSAILSALDSTCPLCRGSGTLTPDQRRHLDEFVRNHPIKHCPECDAVHLVCVASQQES